VRVPLFDQLEQGAVALTSTTASPPPALRISGLGATPVPSRPAAWSCWTGLRALRGHTRPRAVASFLRIGRPGSIEGDGTRHRVE
jgi:hypothetical protein